MPLDQPVDAELMKNLHKKILNEDEMSEKYNAKVALKPSKPHHGCDVFDTRIKEDICNG